MRRIAAALAAFVAFVACAFMGAASAQDHASQALTVAGAVAQPATHAVDALALLPQPNVTIAAPDGSSRRYRGVLLRDLVAAAQPLENGRFALRRSIVVAHATDGYLAVFSWAELFDSALGDGVLVATSRDGRPIDDGEGSFTPVSAADTRAGSRHVRWLDRIELRRVMP